MQRQVQAHHYHRNHIIHCCCKEIKGISYPLLSIFSPVQDVHVQDVPYTLPTVLDIGELTRNNHQAIHEIPLGLHPFTHFHHPCQRCHWDSRTNQDLHIFEYINLCHCYISIISVYIDFKIASLPAPSVLFGIWISAAGIPHAVLIMHWISAKIQK